MKRLGWVWVCAALLGVACGEESTPSVPVATPEPTPPEAVENTDVAPPSPVGEVMRMHFERAANSRDAIVRGDLDSARIDMNWLATHHGGDTLPEHLRPLFAQMQTEAGHFAEATTLTEAATALARTLTRCGGCHRVSHGGPDIAIPPLPEGDSVPAHMQRHRWAADRMWEGLVKDDADVYRTGAGALREGSLFEAELEGRANTQAPRERVRAIANLVHELGTEAAGAETATDRADIYGRLLATCATCHRMLGVGDTVAAGEGVTPTLPEPAPEGATEGE